MEAAVPATTPPTDPLVAFLDIGTNSVRLLIARLHASGMYTVVFEQKETVRLGAGEFARNQLQPDAMRRAGLVCARFVDVARSQGVSEVVAVATSATREASNGARFVRYLKRKAGLDVRVISGKEEARLIYLGVASSLNLGDKPALFLDIGGGSTEFIVGDQSQYLFLDSVPLGSIRVADRFFKPGDTGPVDAAAYARIQRFVRTSTARTLQQLKHYRYDGLIASSGTAMNLAEAAMRKHEKRGLRKDDVVTRVQIRDMIRTLCEMTLEERRKVPGLNPERADIIVAGAAILETILDELDVSEFRVSERGLREGLPIDYLRRSGPSEGEQISFREKSVLELGRRCQFDESHAKHIVRLAWQLFDSAKQAGLHNLGAWERELLEHAAWLHDVGAFVSYNHHRTHSYYLIMNAELLGFHQRELAIIANTALYHHKSFPRPKHAEFAALDKPAREIVRVLCVLLRLAESLDRGHLSVVQRATLRRPDKGGVELEILPNGDCHLEVWELPKHESAFESVFGRKFRVKALRPVAS
jgi:exopolyphosphatase / guanosine-5'-triphosphate,3'-diphosphate pyrophosphatase